MPSGFCCGLFGTEQKRIANASSRALKLDHSWMRSPKKIRIDAGDENCACAGPEGGWHLNLLSNVYYFTEKVAQFTMLALKAQVPNQELSSFSANSTTPAAVSISFLCCLLTNGLQVESLARRKQSTNIARRPLHAIDIFITNCWKFGSVGFQM